MKVTIQLEECEVIVTGEYIPAEYGERDSYGKPVEPDYPAEFLVDGFTLVYDPGEIEITDDMLPVGMIHSKFYDELEAAVLDKLAKETVA